jgi:hypothetical protein
MKEGVAGRLGRVMALVLVSPLALALPQAAAGSATAAASAPRDQVRARLQAEREQIEGRFSDEMAACAQRFAVTACADGLAALWNALLESWPWRDPAPARFGGFAFDGDDAVERTLPTCLAGIGVDASAAERTILDALGTRALDANEAEDALKALRQSVAAVVAGR